MSGNFFNIFPSIIRLLFTTFFYSFCLFANRWTALPFIQNYISILHQSTVTFFHRYDIQLLIFGSISSSDSVYLFFKGHLIHIQIVNFQQNSISVVGWNHIDNWSLIQERDSFSDDILDGWLVNVGMPWFSFLFLPEYYIKWEGFPCRLVLINWILPLDLTNILGIFQIFEILVE